MPPTCWRECISTPRSLRLLLPIPAALQRLRIIHCHLLYPNLFISSSSMLVKALFVQGLFATAALSIPSSNHRFLKRNMPRISHKTSPIKSVYPPAPAPPKGGAPGTNIGSNGTQHNTVYSSNWAGAILNSPAVSAQLLSLLGLFSLIS